MAFCGRDLIRRGILFKKVIICGRWLKKGDFCTTRWWYCFFYFHRNVDFGELLAPEIRAKHKNTTYDLMANIVHDGEPGAGKGTYRVHVLHKVCYHLLLYICDSYKKNLVNFNIKMFFLKISDFWVLCIKFTIGNQRLITFWFSPLITLWFKWNN